LKVASGPDFVLVGTPTLNALLVLRCALSAVLVVILTRTWADPDLWGHVLFGRDIVLERAIASVDPYSFTADRPWINHEWLAEVLMYLAFAAGGGFGLIALKTTVMLVAAAAVLVSLRSSTLTPAVHDSLIFMFVAGTFARAHAFRPQVFSITLFALILLLLRIAERGNWRVLAFAPVVFGLWVNLHGGWLVGLGVFGFWVALKLAVGRREIPLSWLTAIGIATVLATLANPYGWRLWEFVSTTVRLEREAVADWQPLWKLSPLPIAIWFVTASVAAYLVVARRAYINWRFAAIVLLCGAGSVLVSRLDVFFVLATLMLISPTAAQPQEGTATHRTRHIAAILITVAASTIAAIGLVPPLSCVRMDGTWHPEPEVARLVSERQLHGRMLTFFDWGEYAIWHMAPAIKVSMDGRRETVYSERVIADHLAVYRNDPRADKIVAAMNADFLWLPSRSGVIPRLRAGGWSPLFEGPISTLLGSPSMSSGAVVQSATRRHRCFPSP
jgi:hypothetical protein